MVFDREKLETVVLDICCSVPQSELGAVKLNKVLYFLDMRAHVELGVAVTGSDYVKQKYGPTCAQLPSTLTKMIKEGDLSRRRVGYFGREKWEFIAKKKSKHSLLTSEEHRLLHDVIDFVCFKHSAASISEFSHQTPWKMTKMGEKIPYFTAQFLYPRKLTPRVLEAFCAGVAEIEAAGLGKNSLDSEPTSSFRERIQAEISPQ